MSCVTNEHEVEVTRKTEGKACLCTESENDAESEDCLSDDQVSKRTVQAKADYAAVEEGQLSFFKGDVLDVIADEDEYWWWCMREGQIGYAPTNHLSLSANDDTTCEVDWQNDVYFGRYSELQFHLEMLLDRPRTLAYRDAIIKNIANIQGTVVMDVGCGSGILSMLAARDGAARHVYAVDGSSVINLATKVVKKNNLEQKISLHFCRVEELRLKDKVDLIISEWMSTLLIAECMIESVLLARDNFLCVGGKVWPSSATLFMAPCTCENSYQTVSLSHWDNMYDFDFSSFKADAEYELLDKPLHKHIADQNDILGDPHVVVDIDLDTIKVSELEKMESNFKFSIRKDGVLHGFCTWFSATFCPLNDDCDPEQTVVLDTGPWGHTTHWHHPLLLLNHPVHVTEGMIVKGHVILSRHPTYRRHVHMTVIGSILRKDYDQWKVVEQFEKEYRCWQ